MYTLSSRVPGSTHGFPFVEPKDGSHKTKDCSACLEELSVGHIAVLVATPAFTKQLDGACCSNAKLLDIVNNNLHGVTALFEPCPGLCTRTLCLLQQAGGNVDKRWCFQLTKSPKTTSSVGAPKDAREAVHPCLDCCGGLAPRCGHRERSDPRQTRLR